ncbi:glycosyltransferase family 2 protein, partial [Ectobacillus panaciterrae]|uniref:glycosyltransferase family 2 protein n=1 Tax=Ectobacillus panaciterrae TaxID=363872 RepID=UPI000557DE1B
MARSINPLVSVVIPTYNREHQIEKTIKSVLRQTYSNFEIIIVDDASIDNTEDVVKSISDNRIKFIKLKENSQGTRPRNIGIQESIGDYIALLDSDDEWVPTKLEKQLQFIKDYNEDNIMCFTDLIRKSERNEEIIKNKPLRDKEDIMDYIFIGNNLVQTSTFLFPSKIGKETLFNPTLKKHQDWDFCLRLRENSVKFLLFPEPLTIYSVEEREGRISNNAKYPLSLEWGNEVKKHISERAYHAFQIISIVDSLILDEQKKKAMMLYLNAYLKRA